MSEIKTSEDKNIEHGDKWTFNDAVTDAFDEMLARSIPQYDVMRKTVFQIGRRFVRQGTDIVDLGCSRGEALQPFVNEFGAMNFYRGVEVSKPMLEASRKRFDYLIGRGIVAICDMDLRNEYPLVAASLTLAILTIQFTPIEYRQELMRRIWEHTLPGGAFIIVEKVIGGSAHIDRILREQYLAMKSANGYSQEEIERKRLALEGVLVPVTAKWNEELLKSAGFTDIECIWGWCNFRGWLAIKG